VKNLKKFIGTYFSISEARAAEVSSPMRSRVMGPVEQEPAVVQQPAPAATVQEPEPTVDISSFTGDLTQAKFRLDEARHRRNRYNIEIQKKFSLAAACIVLVLVGAPIALRFPRGGVGLVIGVSFLVFAIYYIGLIGGESLANKNIISPILAMWAGNIVFSIIGLLLITKMGNERVTSRGGQLGELIDSIRYRFSRKPTERAKR
jgi:lipopolysaccharide export system permease protein